jgi:hypothetical protein
MWELNHTLQRGKTVALVKQIYLSIYVGFEPTLQIFALPLYR